LCLFASLAASLPARADEAPPQETLSQAFSGPAVQNRAHELHNELYLGGSLLPSDAYSQEGGVVVGFTHHFSDLLGWEIFHAHAYLDWPSGIRNQLENLGKPPEFFSVLRYMLDSNFVISPIYAKLSLLNHNLAYFQFFALAGVGAAVVYGGPPPMGSTLPGLGPHGAALVDVGVGVRLWLSQRWSLRYDLREYISFDTSTGSVSLPLFMSLSAAVTFGGPKR
jgi:outer membrane beta-barrel protein